MIPDWGRQMEIHRPRPRWAEPQEGIHAAQHTLAEVSINANPSYASSRPYCVSRALHVTNCDI